MRLLLFSQAPWAILHKVIRGDFHEFGGRIGQAFAGISHGVSWFERATGGWLCEHRRKALDGVELLAFDLTGGDTFE